MSVKKIILIVIIIFIAAAALMSIKWRSGSKFEKITITGNYTITSEDILNVSRLNDTLLNANEVNIDIIQDRISKHPEIKKVYVSRNLPSEIKIEIIERRPVAILNGENEMKLIDDELEVFPFKNFIKLYDLPVISGVRVENNPNHKNRYNKDDLRLGLFLILNSYKESKTLYNNISEVNLNDSSKIIIYLSEDSSPFYLPRNINANVSNPEYQALLINKLRVFDCYVRQSLNTHLKKSVNYVDLRYTNQVVVNSNN